MEPAVLCQAGSRNDGAGVIGAVVVCAAAAVLSALVTGWTRRLAIARGLLDHPTARSSHEVPTPRGGGLAIVAALVLGTFALALTAALEWRTAIAFLGAVPVAWIGWLDDHGGVRARVRGLVHGLAAVWALAWLGGYSTLRLGASDLPLGPAGPVLAVIGIVWFVNLYNFMDGIDGLAGGEALTVGAVGALLLINSGNRGLAAVALLAAAAAAGFLVWNWPPARIFMGDVGSGVLGYWFGVLALASERAGSVPIVLWVVLLGAFTFDATVTLARRLMRGEQLYQPHRQHAYQRATRTGWSHRRVTSGVLLLNLVLAGAVALGVARPTAVPGILLAITVFMAVIYGAMERRLPMERPVPRAAGPA